MTSTGFRLMPMPTFKVLDRYIVRRFLFIFLVAILAFLLIFHIVDVSEKIDKYIKHNLTMAEIGSYYLYQLPFFIHIILPMSLLLASVFTIGKLGKDNELAAIKSSGISLYRVSVPLLFIGLVLSVFSFFFEDIVVIPASRQRVSMEQNELRGRRQPRQRVFENIMYQDSPQCNIVISRFSTKNQIAQKATIQYTRDHTLVRRIDIPRMKWEPESRQWRLLNFKIRYFDAAGNETVSEIIPDSLITLNLDPQDLIQTTLKPETMRYRELSNFIRRLQQSGNDPRRWLVDQNFKVAFSLTNFIVILFGIPLAASKHKKGISFGAGISLVIIFIYYGFIKFGQIMGYKAVLTPWLSAWIGNILFLSVGGYLFYTIRQ